MKLEVEFIRNATIIQKCRAVIEMDDAESVDKKAIEEILKDPSKNMSLFVVESQELCDVRDKLSKVDRMNNGT